MWLQNTMAVPDKPSNPYDRSSGHFLTPIKFVTAKGVIGRWEIR
jgi:hypothetical protein